MARAVPTRFPAVSFAGAVVGRAVAYPVADGWGGALAYLLGRAKHVVGSVVQLPASNGTSGLYYRKSPGANALLVVCELNETAAATALANVTVACAAVADIPGTVTQLAGASALPCPTSRVRVAQQYTRLLDVSSLVTGTDYEITALVASAAATGSPAKGLYRLAAYEIPRDVLSPETVALDPGVATYFGGAGNDVIDGDAVGTTPGDGLETLLGGLDQGRSLMRRFPVNYSALDDTGAGLSYYASVASSGTFAMLYFNNAATAAGDSLLFTRAKRLYTTTTRNVLRLRVRYNHSLAGTTIFRVTTADGTTYDTTLASTAGAWSNVFGAVQIETNDVLQESSFKFEIKSTGAAAYPAVVYVSRVALCDNES